MLKEMMLVLFILGLPTMFIMTQISIDGATGAIPVNSAKIRELRVTMYLDFPQPYQSPVHKMLAYRVRDYLRKGAHQDYYDYNGLQFGHKFFDNEIHLVGELFKLACLRPTEFVSEGRFISPGGVNVIMPGGKFFNAQFKDIGQVPCSEELRVKAELTLIQLFEIDKALVELSIANSRCPEVAAASMDRARSNIQFGSYEAAITNLRGAWSKSQYCA